MPNKFGPEYSDMNRIVGQNMTNRFEPTSYETEALALIQRLKNDWDDESVFLTDKISYLMRNIITKARKYYHGIFDNPRDEVTGDDKTWVPLTEWSVESVVKSIDLDTKDILIQPNVKDAVGVVPIARAIILHTLKKMGFGQLLNDVLRALATDGTAVVKTVECVDKSTGKKKVKSYLVDLLNFWIDPAAEDVQDSQAVIERIYMSKYELDSYYGTWDNIDLAPMSSSGVTRVDQMFGGWNQTNGELPYTAVWEFWGVIRKAWATNNPADYDKWVEGHVVASGINGPQVVHLIEINPRKDGVRPYEEVWYKRLRGRWYGRGVAEMLFSLQKYANTIVNIRKSNNTLLQNGMFLIRKGSGITPDMISSISAGGGIPVSDINRDIKQLNVQDYRQSSYTDEDRVYLYSDRVTGAFDINRGEVGLASASATATLTRDRHIRDTFVLIQEGVGFFMERLLSRQIIPAIKNILKDGDIVKITGDVDYLQKIDEAYIKHQTNLYIAKTQEETGYRPTDAQLQTYQQAMGDYLKSMGKQRFVKYFSKVFDDTIDIDVSITDERFNRALAVQQLKESLIAFSRTPVASRLNVDAIFNEIFNLMGLRGEFFLDTSQIPVLAPDIAQVGRQLKELPQEMPSETTALENANMMPQTGGQADTGMQKRGLGALANMGVNLGNMQ